MSLVEAIIAVAIFSIALIGVITLILQAADVSRGGVERAEAVLFAEEGIEATRSIRDGDYDNLSNGTHGLAIASNNWTFSGGSDTQGDYTRQVALAAATVTGIDATDIKQATSTVTWPLTDVRQGTTTATTYLTDWNQTHGSAGYLRADISAAELASGDRQIRGVTIENTDTSSITIDKMTLWWNNSNDLDQIRIDGANVYGPGGAGVASGTEVDITDVTLPGSSGDIDINLIKFTGDMTGTDFIILFRMTDGSTYYVYLEEPGSAPGGGQSDSLVVDTSAATLTGANKTIAGITLENSGATDIVIDQMTVTWTGGASGNNLQGITIDGGSVWTGNATSGTQVNITDVNLVSGAGTYPLDALTFKKSMAGSSVTIDFLMGDGTTHTTPSFSP